MRRFFLLLAMALTFLVASPVMAQEGSTARPDGFGIGLGSGSMSSGLSAKIHRGGTAFQGVVGCGYGYYGRGYYSGWCNSLGVSIDVLKNMPIFVDADVVQLAWNIGAGGSLAIGNRFAVGGQFVAGLEFLFPSVPLDLVLEWRPSLGFHSHYDGGGRLYVSPLGFGAHIRIYL